MKLHSILSCCLNDIFLIIIFSIIGHGKHTPCFGLPKLTRMYPYVKYFNKENMTIVETRQRHVIIRLNHFLNIETWSPSIDSL